MLGWRVKAPRAGESRGGIPPSRAPKTVQRLAPLALQDGDANVRSVWLCSRNDAIGNVAVMGAALAVWSTTSAWPDLLVAGIMASLYRSRDGVASAHSGKRRDGIAGLVRVAGERATR
jgi:hypothetical protein